MILVTKSVFLKWARISLSGGAVRDTGHLDNLATGRAAQLWVARANEDECGKTTRMTNEPEQCKDRASRRGLHLDSQRWKQLASHRTKV